MTIAAEKLLPQAKPASSVRECPGSSSNRKVRAGLGRSMTAAKSSILEPIQRSDVVPPASRTPRRVPWRRAPGAGTSMTSTEAGWGSRPEPGKVHARGRRVDNRHSIREDFDRSRQPSETPPRLEAPRRGV